MPIRLYVEELSDDKTFAMSKDESMMVFNAAQMGISTIDENADLKAMIFHAGRYIVVIMMDASEEYGMMFFDFQQNRQRAEEVATELFNDEAHLVFMKTFEGVTLHHEKNYNEVELSLSANFPGQ